MQSQILVQISLIVMVSAIVLSQVDACGDPLLAWKQRVQLILTQQPSIYNDILNGNLRPLNTQPQPFAPPNGPNGPRQPVPGSNIIPNKLTAQQIQTYLASGLTEAQIAMLNN